MEGMTEAPSMQMMFRIKSICKSNIYFPVAPLTVQKTHSWALHVTQHPTLECLVNKEVETLWNV
jgi:hypothetical protein